MWMTTTFVSCFIPPLLGYSIQGCEIRTKFSFEKPEGKRPFASTADTKQIKAKVFCSCA
jgi:hypothetical protein